MRQRTGESEKGRSIGCCWIAEAAAFPNIKSCWMEIIQQDFVFQSLFILLGHHIRHIHFLVALSVRDHNLNRLSGIIVGHLHI